MRKCAVGVGCWVVVVRDVEGEAIMERLLLITLAWTFIVGGAMFLAVLLERTLHQRKMARLEENFRRMKMGARRPVGTPVEEVKRFRRSA